MREGKLRGTFRLTCDQCGKESRQYRKESGGIRACIQDGWVYAMESFAGPVGNDWCPSCGPYLLAVVD